MAHRALTLKYRPQSFADLVGQEHVSRVLQRALETKRVAHAYLFTGARGVGKTTSARILAKALNCTERAAGRVQGADPCNTCTSCLEITSGVSLDVAEIDGASNRGIADVQALREKVRFSPTGGHYRVVIIDEVHQLSNDAFAALLKTLEEPPPHLVFIFATTDPQKVPDTIRSRTQRYDFARVPFRRVADRLLDIREREQKDEGGVRFTLTEGAALLIAHQSEGSMRDAVGALDQVVSAGEADIDEALVRRVLGLADREAFFDLVHAIVSRDPKESLRSLHRAFDKGLDPRDLAEGLTEHVRHVLILKVDPEGADLVAASREDLERLKAQGDGWSENDLLRLLRIASEAMGPMRDSPQPLVHLEAAVFQMATLEPGETLAELLRRLAALEQRLDEGGGPRGTPPSAPGVTGRRGTVTQATPAPTMSPAPTASRVSRPSAPPESGRPGPGPSASTASATPPAATASGATAPAATPPAATASVATVLAATAPAATASVARTISGLAMSRPVGGRPGVSGHDATGATPTAAAAPQLASARGATPTAAAPTVAPARVAAPTAAAPSAPASTAVATPVAVRPGPVDAALDASADVIERWNAALTALHERKRLLGAFLEECVCLGRAGDRLVVAMDDLHRAVVEEKENRVIVGDALRRAFGTAVVLQCASLEAAGSRAERPTVEHTEAMVAKALEWFGGEASPATRDGRAEE